MLHFIHCNYFFYNENILIISLSQISFITLFFPLQTSCTLDGTYLPKLQCTYNNRHECKITIIGGRIKLLFSFIY